MSSMIQRTGLITSLLALAVAAYPQSSGKPTPIAAPVLTVVPDTPHSVRPLIGLTGSASLGPALDLGFESVQLVISAAPNYVIAMTSERKWVIAFQLLGGAPSIRPVDSFWSSDSSANTDCDESYDNSGLIKGSIVAACRRSRNTKWPAQIDKVAISSSGAAAAFYSSSENRIYRFTGLPDSPAFAGTSDVSAAGSIDILAISDDGRTLAVSAADTGTLFIVNGSQQPAFTAVLRHISAMRFVRNSADAWVADDVDDAVYSWSNGQLFTLATQADGIANPNALASSRDNTKLFVSNTRTNSIITISLNGTGPTSVPCKCNLSGLFPTTADSVFRITDFTDGPVLLFDGGSTEPRVLYAPIVSNF